MWACTGYGGRHGEHSVASQVHILRQRPTPTWFGLWRGLVSENEMLRGLVRDRGRQGRFIGPVCDCVCACALTANVHSICPVVPFVNPFPTLVVSDTSYDQPFSTLGPYRRPLCPAAPPNPKNKKTVPNCKQTPIDTLQLSTYGPVHATRGGGGSKVIFFANTVRPKSDTM